MAFARHLAQDFQDHSDGWENRNPATYLEALAGWTADIDGFFNNRGETPPTQLSWKTLAQMLLVARVYE